jgi:hypothetical protein
MRDPEMMARARHAAGRLEQAWGRWRRIHGLVAGRPADPVASYVGYSLMDPMGQPRVVIGIDAVEAEILADFLERHESAMRAAAQTRSAAVRGRPGAAGSAAAPGDRPGRGAAHAGRAAGRGRAGLAVPPPGGQGDPGRPGGTADPRMPPEGTGPHGLQGTPQDPPDVIAAELAGWASSELPGQATKRLAAWTSDVEGEGLPAAPPHPAARPRSGSRPQPGGRPGPASHGAISIG